MLCTPLTGLLPWAVACHEILLHVCRDEGCRGMQGKSLVTGTAAIAAANAWWGCMTVHGSPAAGVAAPTTMAVHARSSNAALQCMLLQTGKAAAPRPQHGPSTRARRPSVAMLHCEGGPWPHLHASRTAPRNSPAGSMLSTEEPAAGIHCTIRPYLHAPSGEDEAHVDEAIEHFCSALNQLMLLLSQDLVGAGLRVQDEVQGIVIVWHLHRGRRGWNSQAHPARYSQGLCRVALLLPAVKAKTDALPVAGTLATLLPSKDAWECIA